MPTDFAAQIKQLGQQRQETLETLDDTNTKITKSENRLGQMFQTFSRQQSHAVERANDALNNIRTAHRLPRVIQRFMGMFDEDLNIDAQKARLDQSNLSLQRIGQQMQLAEQSHLLTTQQAGREAEHSLRVLQFDEQGHIDQMRVAEFGIRMQQHEMQLNAFQRDKLERDLADQSLDTLRKWAKDPSKAPAAYRDKPGLLQGMVLDKVSQEESVLGQQIANQINVGQFAMALERHKIDMEVAEQQRIVRELNSKSMFELEQWRDDPKNAPKWVKDNPGLLESMLEERVSRRQALAGQSLANQVQEHNLVQTRKSAQLRALPEDQLAAIVEGKVALPEGLEFGEVQERLREVRIMDASLKGAMIANKSNDLQLEQQLKSVALSQMSVNEISEHLDAMGESALVTNVEGVEFSREELTTGLFKKSEEAREQQNVTFDRLIAAQGSIGTVQEGMSSAQGLHFALNPGMPFDPNQPFANLPPTIGARAQTIYEKMQAADSLGNADLFTQYANEFRDFMNAEKEKYITDQPKEQQPYIREYIENGRPITSKATNDYLLVNAPNPSLLAGDPVLDGVWSDFSASMHDVTKKQSGAITLVDGELTIGGEKADSAVIVEQAIRDGDVRRKANATLFQYSVLQSFERLAERSPEIWKRFYNPATGTMSEAFYTQDAEGNPSFDLASFSDTLAIETQKIQSEGLIQTGDNLLDMIIHDMQFNSQADLRSLGQADPNGSAMMFALYGNRPEQAIQTNLQRMQQMAPLAVQSAARLQADVERIQETEKITKDLAKQGQPGLGFNEMLSEQIRKGEGFRQ